MKLPKAYNYLTENYSLYMDSLITSTLDNYTFSFLLVVAGILALIGVCSLLLGDNGAGLTMLVFAIVIAAGDLVYFNIEDEPFDTDKYETTLKDFRKDLESEMTKEQTDLPKKEVEYTSFTVIERLTDEEHALFDLTITIENTEIIKRVKVINTDNPNLIGKYRELPDNIALDKKPFYKFDGYLFVKDVSEFDQSNYNELSDSVSLNKEPTLVKHNGDYFIIGTSEFYQNK